MPTTLSYLTMSPVLTAILTVSTFHWVFDRARVGGVPQAVLLTDAWTRSALTRDFPQRLLGETPYEEVIIQERRNGFSWLRDNDDDE